MLKQILFLLFISSNIWGHKMENKYFTWSEFTDSFGKEMNSAVDVYESMKKNGLVDYSLAILDFDFNSDNKENLEKLKNFLIKTYSYSNLVIKKNDNDWELSGETTEIPITEETLLYWALDMYKKGYEFDSILEGYGAPIDHKTQRFPDFDKSKEDFYFDKAIDYYNSGNLSTAFSYLCIVLKINPNDPNSYYSRAIVRNELYTWKSALKDYDRAIELAPDFISAILNRGSLKDENGDYSGAILDYNTVIKISKNDTKHLQRAYFNRGNSKYNIKDKNGACEDWQKAKELGADYANERLNAYCK